MLGGRKQTRELAPPVIAGANHESIEILRVWAAPRAPQQLTLRTCWKDPGAWGILLADVARHAAQAYEHEGHNPNEVLHRIRQVFDAEWSSPTSTADDLTNEI